jgi:hypothetical protein
MESEGFFYNNGSI